MGRAVIAHDNPFNIHVLDSNGLFFSNARELAQKINELEGSEGLKINLESKNLNRAFNHYTWERCMRKHEKAFTLLLGTGPNNH